MKSNEFYTPSHIIEDRPRLQAHRLDVSLNAQVTKDDEALADSRERNKELSGPGSWVLDDGEEVPF